MRRTVKLESIFKIGRRRPEVVKLTRPIHVAAPGLLGSPGVKLRSVGWEWGHHGQHWPPCLNNEHRNNGHHSSTYKFSVDHHLSACEAFCLHLTMHSHQERLPKWIASPGYIGNLSLNSSAVACKVGIVVVGTKRGTMHTFVTCLVSPQLVKWTCWWAGKVCQSLVILMENLVHQSWSRYV